MTSDAQPKIEVSTTPAWIAGMGTLTFGLIVGFTVTALPFLLSRAGVTLDRIAGISAVVMSPTFWGFLVAPVLDTGFSRRTYALLFAVVSAIALSLALLTFSPARLTLFTGLVLVAELAAVLNCAAVYGWYAEFVPDSQRGVVGGWSNAANLGGGAIGAMALMSAARATTNGMMGLLMLGSVLLSAIFLLWFPKPVQPVFGLSQVFSETFRNVARTCRRREVLMGFLVFLTPAGAVAAINLFSGLGKDFHAAETHVVWITGAGVAITSSIGALAGGYIADRVNRGALYLGAGIVAGLTSLTLAFTAHTEPAFICGVLFYNAMAGVTYAAFTALELQLTGNDNPTAATQLALFAASTNGAITYMTWFDGQGYRIDGVRGLFVADGAAAVLTGLALMVFVVRRGRLGNR